MSNTSNSVERRGLGRGRRLGWGLLAGGLVLAGCGGPEEPSPAPAPRVAVVEDPEATTLAVAVAVPGSAWELPGTEGLTMLSALTLLEAVAPELAAVGARAGVTCSPATFTFTLVAARGVEAEALGIFLDGLFRPEPTERALELARRRLRKSLALDEASPSWQARLAVRRALHNDSLSSAWLGPACGVPETLSFFDLGDIWAGAHRFAPRMAVAAAIAPEGSEARDALEGRLPPGPRSVPAPRTATADGVYVERNTVTAWLAVAFPFDRDADIEALRLLGAVLEDAIGPGVDRPESFTAGHEIELHGDGGALVVRAVTTPERAGDYADRIEEMVDGIAGAGVTEAVAERVARRHRGVRLMGLARPEIRATEMATALIYGRTPRSWPDLRIPTSRLQAAAEALGAPARSVVGPRSARGAVSP